MDDFRVLRTDGKPSLLIKIAPAISPVFGNNPGYQIYRYNRQSGELEDYQTFYLTNLSRNNEPALPRAARWAMEYDFRSAYSVRALNAQEVVRLEDRMRTEEPVQQTFRTFYGVSAPGEISSQSFNIYRCAISNISPAGFLTCLNGVPSPLRPLAFPDRRPRAGEKDRR